MAQKKAYQAILESKCPKCRKGQMFMFPIGNITKFTKMHEYCSECELRFEVEPGFFFGAMYISYAFTVAILITTGIVLWIFNITSIVVFLGVTTSISVALLPIIFRYSRVLFLHLFGGIKFNDSVLKKETGVA
jgi:uncharacterized protein (DUF983 family)